MSLIVSEMVLAQFYVMEHLPLLGKKITKEQT
jgi:hypothetical protein